MVVEVNVAQLNLGGNHARKAVKDFVDAFAVEGARLHHHREPAVLAQRVTSAVRISRPSGGTVACPCDVVADPIDRRRSLTVPVVVLDVDSEMELATPPAVIVDVDPTLLCLAGMVTSGVPDARSSLGEGPRVVEGRLGPAKRGV